MEKKTHIDVRVSVAEIRNSLRKRIVSEHADLITDVIMGHLEKTEVGYQQLYMSLSGVQEKLRFSAGDKVVIGLDYLPSWKFNKEKTIDAGLVIQGRVKAKITEVDPYMEYPYTVKAILKDNNGDNKEVIGSTSINSVCLEEEWPNPESDVKGDQPF